MKIFKIIVLWALVIILCITIYDYGKIKYYWYEDTENPGWGHLLKTYKGENLGQVASQTLDNLAVLDNAVKIPVLRPLLCFDKNETIKIAKEIKTYELSENKKCLFVPRHPATKAKIEIIKKEESKLDVKNIINKP